MHLTVVKSDLVCCLHLACTFPERDAPKPILRNSLLSVVDAGDKQLLRVTASDLRQTLISHAPCTASIPGALALSAKTLSEVVGVLPEGPVELRVDGTRLVVGSGRRASKIPFELGENFPTMPDVDPAFQPVVMDASALVSLIDRVYRCAGKDVSAPAIMCSIVLEIGDGIARSVALDGKMLGVAQDDYSGESGMAVVVPVSGAKRLLTALEKYSGPVSMTYSTRLGENGIPELIVQFGGVQFATKRFERDAYPQYEQVLDVELPHRMMLPRKAFISSCEAVSRVLDKDEFFKVALELDAGELALATQSSTGKAANDAISGVEHDRPLRWLMNLNNIADALAPMSSDTVEVRFLDDLTSFAFCTPGSDSYTAVVSPCRS